MKNIFDIARDTYNTLKNQPDSNTGDLGLDLKKDLEKSLVESQAFLVFTVEDEYKEAKKFIYEDNSFPPYTKTAFKRAKIITALSALEAMNVLGFDVQDDINSLEKIAQKHKFTLAGLVELCRARKLVDRTAEVQAILEYSNNEEEKIMEILIGKPELSDDETIELSNLIYENSGIFVKPQYIPVQDKNTILLFQELKGKTVNYEYNPEDDSLFDDNMPDFFRTDERMGIFSYADDYNNSFVQSNLLLIKAENKEYQETIHENAGV